MLVGGKADESIDWKEIVLDPQIVKDLDDLREKCRSATSANERSSNGDPRLRPKSSLSTSLTRAPSASKSSSTSSTRPKSSKGARAEKKPTEQQTTTKKKSTTNGHKHRPATTLDDHDLDENEENDIPLVEDEELDEDEGQERAIFPSLLFLSSYRKWKI